MTNIQQFFRELKKERTRILLTILAIVWGTASVVIMLAIGEGVTRGLQRGMHGMGKGIVVVWSGETSKPFKGLGIGRKIHLREEDARMLQEQIPGIGLMSPEYIRWGAYFTWDDHSMSTRATGVYPAYGQLRNIYPQKGGRFLNKLDLQSRRRVVFLGNEVKERLFGDKEAVGETVYLNRVPFTVIGVLKKKLQTSCYSGMDQDATFIPASTFRVMFGHRHLSDIVYSPRDISKAKQVKEQIYKLMGKRYQFDPQDKDTLRMWDTIEMQEGFGKVSTGVRIFLGIIGGLTLIVAGVGLANIMYAVIRNRTREIGIKIAVGAKRRNIITEYILQSLLTVSAGGVIGLGFSWSLVKVINIIPLKQEAFQYLGRPVMSVTTALITAGVLGLVGFLAGIFPARRAASVNPVDALRYE